MVTAVRRQTAKKTGAEWAQVTIEDFHGTAECLAFPEAWKKLSAVIMPDAAYLFLGGYSQRDRGEDDAPFILESAEPLVGLRNSGRVALALRWGAKTRLAPDAGRAIAAVCAAHPGPAPVLVEWNDDNGGESSARFRARGLRVALDDDLIRALRELLGADGVALVKAG